MMVREWDGAGQGMADSGALSVPGRGAHAGRPGDDVVVRSGRALGSPTGRPVVVVLGMHRSGTSLLSNVLHFLGVDMADETDQVSPKNAGGFWERPALVAIHDEILAVIDRPIGKPGHLLPFPPGWWRRKDVQALKPKLIDYVRGELAKSSNPWGFKDPRTCRLLPLWWEVFRELDLKPVYVHAVRSPAEASVSMSQKSSVRKLTVASGELMWLSYNYDVIRYVTAEHPTIVVDYESWFSDGTAVAHRLVGALGIGEDLSPEDVAECVSSIVQRDFRHQVAGKAGVASRAPLATMLYEAITANTPLTADDVRALREQMPFVDLLLKSLAPITADLDAAMDERTDMQALQSDAQEREREARANRDADAVREAERTARFAGLEDEIVSLRTKLVATRRSLAHAQDLAGLSTEFTGKLAGERDWLSQRLAPVEEAMSALAARIDAGAGQHEETTRAFPDQLAGLLASGLAGERTWLAGQLAPLGDRLTSLNDGVSAAAEAREDAVRQAADEAVDRLERQIEQQRQQLAEQRRLFERGLERQRRRLRSVLAIAGSWRAAARQMQEDGMAVRTRAEEAARVAEERLRASAGEAAEISRVGDELRHRLSIEADRNRRFAIELRDRDERIAGLQARIAEQPAATAEPSVETFVWPAGESAPMASGTIERVDYEGIAGIVGFVDRPELIPVIELRIEGELILALSCGATGADRLGSGGWRFLIDWRNIAPDHAGRLAVVRVAGIDHELGEVRIPADLDRFKRSRASIAADLFGGTVEEADEYLRWLPAHETAGDSTIARDFHDRDAAGWPLVSVIVHGPGADWPVTIQALRGQVHTRWEAICIGAPAALAELDPRVRVLPAAAIDEDLRGCAADALLSFVEAGDTLAPTALLQLAAAARATPAFSLIYSDEDLVDPASGVRGKPHMKGAWSSDLALVQDYVSRLALVRRGSVPQGFAHGLDAAGVYRIVLSAALGDGAGPVVHLPFVLYNRSIVNKGAAADLRTAVSAVLADAPAAVSGASLRSVEGGWRMDWPLPQPAPRVSLLVPTRDRVDLLRVCIDGFLRETRYPDLEILIADNDSVEAETKAYLAEVSADPRVRVIPCPGPFNYSTINNAAAAHATGTLIGLMNNDLKVIEPDWLLRMAAQAMRPDVGIVGAKLLHGDDTIQHAGVTLGIGIASHLYKSFPADAAGRHDRLILPHDLSAVTAACLLMRRAVWDEVGGLDEDFPVAYNDVDLCLKVTAAGYRILWSPDVLVYHLESQSRGKDVSPEKRERLNADKARLAARWGKRLERDPFHSPNLSVAHVDARLAFPARATPVWRPVKV